MYHVSVHFLAQRVLSHIRRLELLRAGDRVGVAVSGGIDSVALLRVLLELRGEFGIVLSVVHFNHKLRGAESDADSAFVAGLARANDLEFYVDDDDVAQFAADKHVSLETAARELRYGFFHYLLGEDGNGDPQGLKPNSLSTHLRGPEGPLFHDGSPFHDGGERGVVAHLDKIVTGHTLDDQAETVLMRVIRGAGLRGLGGIHPRLLVEDENGEICGEIVRPLFAVRRRELEQYLKDLGQPWREDSTNADDSFTRNRVRKLIVPLLEKEFNPAVAENLSELAEIARGEEDYWDNEVAGWMGTTVHWSEPEWARTKSGGDGLIRIGGGGVQPSVSGKVPTSRANDAREMGHPAADSDLQSRIDDAPWLVANASVSRAWLLSESTAVQRRLVKAIGERAGIPLEFKHVEEILRFAAEDGSGKELSLPLGWKAVTEPGELAFVTPDLREPQPLQDYEYELPLSVPLGVVEAGLIIEALRVPADAAAGYNPDHLLDAESLPGPLRVRNWRPGDRFWPAHTKSPKKVKELLQERHVAQPERKVWPVVVSGDQIVWLRGFRVPAKFRAKAGREAILVLDTPSTAELAK
jgi:tRNA(Ile)-lysidine synthase